MSNINVVQVPTISDASSEILSFYHKKYGEKEVPTGCQIATASFLIIGALIVIGSSCLCLTLPGVNVMNDIVLKAIIPSSGALLLSIPLIVGGILDRRAMNDIRTRLVNKILEEIDTHKVIDLPTNKKQNQQADFLLVNFLKWTKEDPSNWESNWKKNTTWTKEYQGKLLAELKQKIEKTLPENKTEPQKTFLSSFDEARSEIYAKPKKKT